MCKEAQNVRSPEEAGRFQNSATPKLPLISGESCSGCEGLGRGPSGVDVQCHELAVSASRSEWLCRLPSGLHSAIESPRSYEICQYVVQDASGMVVQMPCAFASWRLAACHE